MGLDTSDAAGDDDIALIIREVKTGAVVAAGNYNEVNLITFSTWLATWFERFTNLLLIIERKSTGSMIIDHLLAILPSKRIDPVTRIFNKIIHEMDEYPDRYKEFMAVKYRDESFYARYKKMFGFVTSAVGYTARSELYGRTLRDTVNMMGALTHDRKTILQLCSLVIRNGRVDHPVGGNDDMSIAYLLSGWILLSGKYLDRYNIDTRIILQDNVVNKKENDPILLWEQRQNAKLKAEIDNLLKELSETRDPYLSQSLEQSIVSKASRLKDEHVNQTSVNELLENIKKTKKQQSFANHNSYSRYRY
jgi:hypothetical protein